MLDHGQECEAYAAYLNTPRGFLDDDEQELFDQDLIKARAQMERAWLENKPTQGEQMTVELTDEEARALAAYIREHGFDYAQGATIGVILEKCDAGDRDE